MHPIQVRNRVAKAARSGIHRALSLLLTFALLSAAVPITFSPVSAGVADLVQNDYRVYRNADAVQPTTALAAENTVANGQTQGAVYQIRLNVNNSTNPKINAGGVTLTLQHATSTGGPWTDVGQPGTGTTWRGFNNPAPADAAALSAALLASTDSAQTYEEANDTTNANTILRNKVSEWGWVIQDNGAVGGTTYFFRLVLAGGTALSGYTNYPEITPAVAGVTLTESGGSTAAVEGGATDTYDVVLDAEPSSDVTITVSPDADVSVSTTTLTFTTSNFATPQTVTVTAVNDAVVEGAHTGTVTHSASGGGYGGESISSVVANVTDNDTGSVTITETAASTDATEGGATDTYDVVLDLEPSGTVTITLSPDADVSVSSGTLTFTTGDWDTPQTVTVTAVNDAIVEGAHTGTITHSASGGSYDGVSISSVVANVSDNDTGSVTIAETGTSTAAVEGGATDTYDVVLDLEPSGTVTITLSPDSDVSLSSGTLTFTTGDWDTPQTVTVTAVNDAVVEGAHTGTITHSAAGGSYDGVSISDVVANVTDNDTGSVTITETGTSTAVTEGGATDTYDVVLDLEPSATVTITISPDSQVNVSTTTLTFTTGNFATPQTVTVSAVDDMIIEGGHTGTVTHSASGGNYDEVSISNVVANVTDDDAASVTVTESGGSTAVTEGGATDTYDVVLDAEPSGNVTITISPDFDVSVGTTTLTFTIGNFETPQTVIVTAVDDAIVEGAHTGTVSHSAAGGGYDGASINNVVANVTDDDTGSVTIAETGTSTAVVEGGATDTYDVVLDLEPSSTVTITLSPDSDVSLSSGTLTFTTGDWDTPQTITVTAVNDAVVEGAHTGTVTHSAAGGSYDGVSISDVVANVTDNDTGSVTITETAASTDVTEAGATDTYDVVLDLEPSGTVTITVSPDSQVSVSTTTLTFTTGDWASPQTVTVSAVDDGVVEDAHTGTITHSAAGGAYDGVSISSVVANVTDDDASVTVTESAASTDVTEGGATDTYDVVLDLQPTGTVTITISPDSQVSVSTTTLTFTTGDWDTPQTVTVSAVDDGAVEGLHTGTTTHSASGGGYGGVSIPSVVASVTDDDASVTVTESAASTDVTEGGTTDTYDVVLDAQPTGTVTITVSPDAQVSVSTTTLTFTTGDWDTPQTITVTAVDDLVVEGPHTGTATHSAGGGGYDGVSISSVVASVTDNNVGSVNITETGTSTAVVEGGATDTYNVVLDLEPSGTVTITVSPDSQVSVSSTTLTFTTGDWFMQQTVTVSAVDDGVVEDPHTGTITHSAAGGAYDGISISSVVASVTDDDASVTITETAASTDVTEGGATDTYDVVLDLQPTGTVTITISPDSQVNVSTATLTFTTGDWDTPQTVTVSAADDGVVEGLHTGTTTHSASGGGYGGVAISNVIASITDDDASVTVTETAASTDVTEGGAADTYDVVLDAQPTGTVTITVSPDSQVSVSTTTLTFTTGDWDTPQTITVTAVDDEVVEGAHTGTVTHSAAGGSYDGVSISNLVANVTDNDTGSVTITETAASTDVTEGGTTDTYDIVLDLEPSGTVTITISPDSQVSVSTTTLTFTTGDWDTPQTVTVSAVDDGVVEDAHTGTITHSAAGGAYDGVSISSVVANVTDDDASVTVTETAASTDVTEGGATDTYDVVLDLQPTGTVTITISPDSQVNVSTTTLTFTTGDWDTPQTVTVSAADDGVVEGLHTGTTTHSASGGGYGGVSISSVVANVTDDDASVTVTETAASTDVTEGGATDTYDVVLDAQPTGSVTITISPDSQVSVSTTTLTFTTGNWDTPQTVTVTAVDDEVNEGLHTGTTTHSATGGGYGGVSIAAVAASITDNDVVVYDQLDYQWFTNADSETPGASLAAESTPLTGAAKSTPYHIRMNVQPTQVVSTGQVFKLLYSVSTTSGPWIDVEAATSSSATWRGFDNPTPADGATLGAALLTTSFSNASQTYEEGNPTAPTVNSIGKNKAAEWAWVVQPNGTLANTTYYFRMVWDDDTPLETYTSYPQVTMGNETPDAPTSLGPAQFVDNDTGWTTDDTPGVTFSISDANTEQQVRFQVQVATTSTFTALVVDYTSDLQGQGAASFTVGQSGGSYAVGASGMTLADNGTGYWWRVKTVDELAAESAYSDAGASGTADFRVDATAPSGGSVLDGTGVDIDFNDGSLTTMSANWSGFSDADSGIAFYEYSVGTTPGAIDIRGWNGVSTSTDVTTGILVLNTGQTYYFNVRATDVAGNAMVSPASSDGQAVLPTLTVSVSDSELQLANLNTNNANTATTTVTVTVSTNAYRGYVVRMYTPDFLRSVENPAVIILDFSAGSYDSPAEWSGTGWGFNTDDCDLNGGAFWTGAGCTGNPKYAPITQVTPGNAVADHTALITGATGPVASEQVVITLRASTAVSQEASTYTTSPIFVVVPEY